MHVSTSIGKVNVFHCSTWKAWLPAMWQSLTSGLNSFMSFLLLCLIIICNLLISSSLLLLCNRNYYQMFWLNAPVWLKHSVTMSAMVFCLISWYQWIFLFPFTCICSMGCIVMLINICGHILITVVSRKYAPPFVTLAWYACTSQWMHAWHMHAKLTGHVIVRIIRIWKSLHSHHYRLLTVQLA